MIWHCLLYMYYCLYFMCRQKCTESDVKTFQCFQGFFGGYGHVTSQQYCNSTHFIKDSWFLVTCIVAENNAFLGYFYYPVDFLKSVSAYSSDYSYRLLSNQHTVLLLLLLPTNAAW